MAVPGPVFGVEGRDRSERPGADSRAGPRSGRSQPASCPLVTVSARRVIRDNISRPHPGHTGTPFSYLGDGYNVMV
jgi:hypothetical protein